MIRKPHFRMQDNSKWDTGMTERLPCPKLAAICYLFLAMVPRKVNGNFLSMKRAGQCCQRASKQYRKLVLDPGIFHMLVSSKKCTFLASFQHMNQVSSMHHYILLFLQQVRASWGWCCYHCPSTTAAVIVVATVDDSADDNDENDGNEGEEGRVMMLIMTMLFSSQL